MEKLLPLVTIVITTYKREPELVERAIKSALNQTYKNVEMIVVDDSPSTYKLRNQVKLMTEKYGDNIIYIPHEKNMGACVARNTGLNASHGEYIAYLDDDDEWMPTKIELLMKLFTNENIALAYCGYIVKNDTTDVVKSYDAKIYEGNIYERLILEGNFIGSTSFPVIRTECLKTIGGFDPLMESAQDADVWIRIAQRYDVAGITDPLVIYHIHDGERITSNPQKKINGIVRLQEKNWDFISSSNDAQARYSMILASLCAHDGKFKKALRYWWNGVLKSPFNVINNVKCFLKVVYRYFGCLSRN